MNRFKCPACGRSQYTSCEHQKLEKMDKLEPEDIEKQDLFL